MFQIKTHTEEHLLTQLVCISGNVVLRYLKTFLLMKRLPVVSGVEAWLSVKDGCSVSSGSGSACSLLGPRGGGLSRGATECCAYESTHLCLCTCGHVVNDCIGNYAKNNKSHVPRLISLSCFMLNWYFFPFIR